MDRVQSITQAYSQAPWRKQLQVIGLFLLVLVFVALVAGIYLNVTARAATSGRAIQSMQADIETIQRDNEDLQSQLALITSAGEMEKRAKSMGFEPVGKDQSQFIVIPEYVERQPVVLAPGTSQVVVSAPVLPAEYTESIFEWLRKQAVQSSFPLLLKVVKP